MAAPFLKTRRTNLSPHCTGTRAAHGPCVDLREFRWAGAIDSHLMRKSRIRACNLNHCCINTGIQPTGAGPIPVNDSRLRQSCQTYTDRHILTGHSQSKAHCDLRGVSVLTG